MGEMICFLSLEVPQLFIFLHSLSSCTFRQTFSLSRFSLIFSIYLWSKPKGNVIYEKKPFLMNGYILGLNCLLIFNFGS